ncbi:hypothetical protein OF387_08380 [Lentilactobacillus hilgardii]|nr:hypothetical protein [Lentilactobacillus hilgardii]MCV3741244.1 hypothetical protein [Lentilactobacillus hilgardii]
MKFIITVTINQPIRQLDWLAFITNLQRQNYADVMINIRTNSPINVQHLADVRTTIPIKINLSLNHQDAYLIHLKVSDRLLPGAFYQWQSVIYHHSAPLVFLTAFDQQTSLSQQLDQQLDRYKDSAVLTTLLNHFIHQDKRSTTLSNQDKALLLVALQKYQLVTDKQYLPHLAQLLAPNRILLQANQLNNSSKWLANVQKIIQRTAKIPLLTMPTLQATPYPVFSSISEIDNALKLLPTASQPIKVGWQQYLINQLEALLRSRMIRESVASPDTRQFKKLGELLEHTDEVVLKKHRHLWWLHRLPNWFVRRIIS